MKGMTKRLLLVLVLFFCVFLYAQEGHDSRSLKQSGGTKDWIFSAATPETSEVFPLYSEQTWKGNFNDTSGTYNDSIAYTVDLYTSSISMSYDSSFTFQQTIFNSATCTDGDSSSVSFHGGWTRPKLINVTPERFGVIIVRKNATTCTKLDSAMIGECYINGWSNQPGARLSKIGY